jgi:heme exporter protein C
MFGRNNNLARVYWAVTLATLAAAIGVLLTYTPTEATMGTVQKVFYLHLPLAITTFLTALVCFVASAGYLWQRTAWWDDLAAAGAKVAVVLCSGVLLTGMIWGRSAWGQWWTWSPRLTFSLVLFLLYAAYAAVRASVESPQRRAVVCAVYGVIAFLDVPLVWLSARLIPEIHPPGVGLAGPMKLTLVVWFVPVTLAAAGFVAARYRLNRAERELPRPRGSPGWKPTEAKPPPRPAAAPRLAHAPGGAL